MKRKGKMGGGMTKKTGMKKKGMRGGGMMKKGMRGGGMAKKKKK